MWILQSHQIEIVILCHEYWSKIEYRGTTIHQPPSYFNDIKYIKVNIRIIFCSLAVQTLYVIVV